MNDNNDDISNPDDLMIIDDTESDQTVAPVQYDITCYGADLDAEGLVTRLRRDDIYIPPFQRDYVWTQKEASRFIESLLLGLPVPGIFLARDSDSKRLLVIDGQQRLKTLQFFYDGFFNPKPDATRKIVFKLEGVQNQFESKEYKTLDDEDKIILNDSIIHATIVRQESPEGDNSSIYHIFERLNNSGRKLSPQQIRVAIYHDGFVINMLHELNSHGSWRNIYGRASKTLKDEELILRFFALYYFRNDYKRPMKDFLNNITERIIKQGVKRCEELKELFMSTIDFIFSALGSKAFKPERAINAAVFDSIMVATAIRLQNEPELSTESFIFSYESLLNNNDYIDLVSSSTSDEANVSNRISMAIESIGS